MLVNDFAAPLMLALLLCSASASLADEPTQTTTPETVLALERLAALGGAFDRALTDQLDNHLDQLVQRLLDRQTEMLAQRFTYGKRSTALAARRSF